MTVRVYRWDDASAPTLTGQLGSLTTLLNACLVTGYGAKAAAGWSSPYSGTNKRVFRNGTGSTQMYLRVCHDATTDGYNARVVGYETMTGVDTGTKPFPTTAQVSGGDYITVSDTTDSTTRPWVVVADAKRFYLWCGQDQTSANGFTSTTAKMLYFFGDVISRKAVDPYKFLIAANATSGYTGNYFAYNVGGLSTVVPGNYFARSYNGTGGSIAAGKQAEYGYYAYNFGTGGPAYPDPLTNGMNMAQIRVHEQGVERGKLPGCWSPIHELPGNNGDTFTGVGALSGKTFMLLDCSMSSTRARVAIEISDTWE